MCLFQICRCTATAQGPNQRRDQWPEGFRRLCLCLWQAGRCAGTTLRVCLAQATALLCACFSCPDSVRSSQIQSPRSVQPVQNSLIMQAVGCSSPSHIPPEGPELAGSESACTTRLLPRPLPAVTLNLRHAAKSIQPACVGPDGPRCDRQAKPELRDLTGGSGKGTGTLSSRTAVLSGLRGLPAARTAHRTVRCAALLGSLRNGFPDCLDMCLQSPPPSSSSPCVLAISLAHREHCMARQHLPVHHWVLTVPGSVAA